MGKREWRLLPGGPHHFDGHHGLPMTVLPGETVECEEYMIEAFRERWEPIGPDPEVELPKVGHRMEHVGGGKYLIIDEVSGKPITEKATTKLIAMRRLDSLRTPGVDYGDGTSGQDAGDDTTGGEEGETEEEARGDEEAGAEEVQERPEAGDE